MQEHFMLSLRAGQLFLVSLSGGEGSLRSELGRELGRESTVQPLIPHKSP